MASEVTISLVFNILLAIVGVWVYSSRTQIKTKAEQQEMDNKLRLQDAESRLSRQNAEIRERSELLGMIRELTKQGQTFLASLDKMEEQKEEDYKVLKHVVEDGTRNVLTEIKNAEGRFVKRIDELDASLGTKSTEWIQTVASEFAVTLANKFNEVIAQQSNYPFPTPNDPEWHGDFMKALVTHAHVYDRTIATEANRIGVEIATEGQNVELIRGWKKDWIGVRFVHNGKPIWGWVQEHEVVVGKTAVKLATSEVTVVPAS
mgnify:CR=1 FL=1|jgi:hypothetical protein